MLRLLIKLVAGQLVGRLEEVAPGPTVRARLWEIDPSYWTDLSQADFPESDLLDTANRPDLGVAFSGGGTRSASATLGQLRGLQLNGWLARTKYITAASGGSWCSVPFSFSATELPELLGPAQAPADLSLSSLKVARDGSLAKTISNSRISGPAAPEVLMRLAERLASEAQTQPAGSLAPLLAQLGSIAGARDEDDETYSRIIGRIFIEPHVPDGARRFFSWNQATLQEALALNPQLSSDGFILCAPDRPFLIVMGTIIHHRGGFEYPRLIPVEYTPYYTGVRQQFGTRLGGIYVSSYAYDSNHPALDSDGALRVQLKSRGSRFTLTDVVGSSGAAPQLTFYTSGLRESIAELPRQFFPEFDHWSLRGGTFREAFVDIPHGDGGFCDNLALTPLLARQVRNIVVFVNSSSDFRTSDQLRSYFGLSQTRDRNGDRTMNHVLDDAGASGSRHQELIAALDSKVQAGQPAIHCGEYTAIGNELFNIRPYDGVRICWVYNYPVERWRSQIGDASLAGAIPDRVVNGVLHGGNDPFDRFPWYRTFGEAAPRVIDLSLPQVQLLAHLSCWNLTNDDSRTEIESFFGTVLT